MVALLDSYCGLYMAIRRALRRSMGLRDRCRMSLRCVPSKLADAAYKEGRLQDEIVRSRYGIRKAKLPVRCSWKTTPASADNARSPGEAAARVWPWAGEGCTVTAGNASGIVDGGAGWWSCRSSRRRNAI